MKTTPVRSLYQVSAWLCLGLLLLVIGCSAPDAGSPAIDGAVGVARSAVTSGVARVNCGGPAVGSFVADTNFSGGSTVTSTNLIDIGSAYNPAPASVYQSQRSGNMTYTFPGFVAGSSHDIRLHFADTHWTTPGSRVFSVSINGSQVLTNFDVVATAGAGNKAVVETFTQAANSAGAYLIEFTTITDAATISGIEIVNSTNTLTASGTWGGCVGGGISPFPGGFPSNCAVLTDGRVLCNGSSGPSGSHEWWALTPRSDTGSYVCGHWSAVGSSVLSRTFNPGSIMRDGRYLNCGGEYSDLGTFATSECEVFDPVTNAWTVVQPMPELVNDTPASILPNGSVMMLGYRQAESYAFDPISNFWRTTASQPSPIVDNESGSVLLQDGTVLYGLGIFKTYRPNSDTWVDDTSATPGSALGEFQSHPVHSIEPEIGPFLLLSDGQVLVLGGNSHNGLYNPLTDTWQLAAETPIGSDPNNPLNHGDTPACVEPKTGNVFTVATADPDGSGVGPSFLYEYQPGTNSWATIPPPPAAFDVDANRVRLLPLPSGEIFVGGNSTGMISVWTPTSGNYDAWRPVLNSLSPVVFGKVRVDGTQFNGIMSGADFGDDGKVASNFPLVSLHTSSSVTYVRTHDFSQMTPGPGLATYFFFDAPISSLNKSYDVYVSSAIGQESLTHGVFKTPYIDVGPAVLATLLSP